MTAVQQKKAAQEDSAKKAKKASKADTVPLAEAMGTTKGKASKKQEPKQAAPATPKAATPSKASNGKTSKGKAAQAAPESYSDLVKLGILDKSLAERQRLAIGRAGAIVAPRRFHLSDSDVEALKVEYKASKKFPNPHNRGAYWGFVAALTSLGTDKAHPFKAVKAEMKKLMSAEGDLWERFANKQGKAQNDDDNNSLDERIKLNAEVLQRLGGFTPYGMRIHMVGTEVLKTRGAVIDILRGEKEPSYRLNTNSATPTNEYRKRNAK